MIFMTIYPFLFAPYFAQLSYSYGYYSGIYVSLTSSVMLTALQRISDELEDPFDEDGLDDINLDMLGEVKQHMFL